MAGLMFGTSRWDDIPRILGLSAHPDGAMRGQWRGLAVEARFSIDHDEQRDTYAHYTTLWLRLDPPLGLYGLEGGALFDRVAPPELRAEVERRAKALGLREVSIRDGGFSARWHEHQSGVERYRAAFELFAWAAQIILDLRLKNPPPWEIEIGKEWPMLAEWWSLTFDGRRGTMKGTVQGHVTSARIVVEAGALMTCVEVEVTLPPNCSLSLARQESDGFFAKLFRGQDILVGDAEFDAAFIIKGEPEPFVRHALSPSARAQILGISHAGCSITLSNGLLTVWSKSLLTNRAHLDALMKAAFSAAVALCPPSPAAPGLVPYR